MTISQKRQMQSVKSCIVSSSGTHGAHTLGLARTRLALQGYAIVHFGTLSHAATFDRQLLLAQA